MSFLWPSGSSKEPASAVETEAEFEAIESSMVRVGDVKTFENFIVEAGQGVDINTVVVWCETFGEFITAAQKR